MNESLVKSDLEGEGSTINKVDVLDYLSFAHAQVYLKSIKNTKLNIIENNFFSKET